MQRIDNRQQAGLTVVELMIALTLGMIVMLAILGLVTTARLLHTRQVEIGEMQDTARHVFDNIARSVRQAGYIDYDDSNSAATLSNDMPPGIVGFDASTLLAKSPGIDAPIKNTKNPSDVLAIRFLNAANQIDSPLNCAGYSVVAPDRSESADREIGWSIYYVANDRNGQSSLFCKFKHKTFTAQVIAEGVDTFQLRYGLDTSNPGNGIANQFLSATEIDALDADIPTSDLNKNTHWRKVTSVKVSLHIRANSSSINTGVKQKQPTEKLFSTTIQLKNPLN